MAISNHVANPKPFTLAIIGGGLVGLVLAAGLSSRGIKVRVYEAKPVFTEISAGISISPNAYRAMQRVDARMFAAYNTIRTLNASEDKQGVWFNFRLGMQEGLDLVDPVHINRLENGNLHRGRFLAELVKLFPEGSAMLGKTLVGMQQVAEGVVMHFSDGTSEVADAVVGCDGIHSSVRKIMVGDAPAFTDVYCYRGLASMEDAVEAVGEELALNSQVYMGTNGNVVTYPIEEGGMLNIVAFRKHTGQGWQEDDWVMAAAPGQLLADFQGWASPVQNLLKVSLNLLFSSLPSFKPWY